jgi:hypothetical protein
MVNDQSFTHQNRPKVSRNCMNFHKILVCELRSLLAKQTNKIKRIKGWSATLWDDWLTTT